LDQFEKNALSIANMTQTTRNGLPEFDLAAADVERFREMLEQLTGLTFADWRMDGLRRAMAARMSAHGIRQASRYLRMFESAGLRQKELSSILDLLTVNETYFFRYPAQMDFFRQSVLPELARQRQGLSPIRVWSAGCSTGEEPYSLAIIAWELFGSEASRRVEIVATDVSAAALHAARRAEYGPRSLRLLDAACRARYFQPLPGDRFLLRDFIRQMVQFRHGSLLDDLQRPDIWEVVFCRNVLIYFAPAAAERFLRGLTQRLRPEGYLFVGHSETIDAQFFVPAGPAELFVYRRADRPSSRRQQRQPPAARPATQPRAPARPDSGSARTAPSEPRCEPLFRQAQTLFDREEYESARACLDRLLQSSPHHLAAYLLRANVSLHQGEHDRSVRECQFVLELDPLIAEAYLLLGLNFKFLGHTELAIEHFRKAVYLRPDLFAAQFHLAEAYRACQQTDEARRAYRIALELLPQADDRQLRNYCAGFPRSTLKTLCEHWRQS